MSRQGDHREANSGTISDFWENEAKQIGETPQVTIRDHFFRLHEIHTYLNIIPNCTKLLDVGCGTGFGTSFFAHRSKFTLGVDYSDNMIKWANRLLTDNQYREAVNKKFSLLYDMGRSQGESVKFHTGNILDMQLDAADYDVITAQRVLINLVTADNQMKALKELRKCCKEGALLVLTEATLQGHKKTDDFRKKFELPILEKYWHNTYLDEESFGSWKDYGWKIKYVLTFDTYALLSKVIYPASCGQEKCEFLSGANAAASEIASLFRTKHAVDEVGCDNFFELYVEKVKHYDPEVGRLIADWLIRNKNALPDWSGLGHQKLIVAYAI